jgi:hypothetical protein
VGWWVCGTSVVVGSGWVRLVVTRWRAASRPGGGGAQTRCSQAIGLDKAKTADKERPRALPRRPPGLIAAAAVFCLRRSESGCMWVALVGGV